MSSSPEALTLTKSLIFFTAEDTFTGRELWVMPGFAANLPPQAVQHLPSDFRGLQKYPSGTGQDLAQLLRVLNDNTLDIESPDDEQ